MTISIHKALAGLDEYGQSGGRNGNISIHKALAGLDALPAMLHFLSFFISIHKALAGLDFCMVKLSILHPIFQSTRPSRASTVNSSGLSCINCDFNPQGPRGPRLEYSLALLDSDMISIHKALAGLDLYLILSHTLLLISIHKALAGLDQKRKKRISC